MIELSASLVAFNVLKNREFVSYKELKQIRDKVQKKHQNVYLHICREDIYEVRVKYQNYFVDLDNLHLCKLNLNSKEQYEKMRQIFDSDIPEKIREDVLKMLSE